LKLKGKKEFTPAMWEMANGSAEYFCLDCGRGKKQIGMWTCTSPHCKKRKLIEDFKQAILKYGGDPKKVRGTQKRCDECYDRDRTSSLEMWKRNMMHIQKHSEPAAKRRRD
jgi:hypothetical protein